MPSISNTAEPVKPRRRWFQFKLRTLLIGVVLLGSACGYVAHELRIVGARKAWLSHHGLAHDVTDFAVHDSPQLPLVRRILGDKPQDFWFICNRGEIAAAKELFPEAKFVAIHLRGGDPAEMEKASLFLQSLDDSATVPKSSP